MLAEHMKIVLKTVGCRTNQEEFTELTTALAESGFHVETDLQKADIVMVNTCSVTGVTESKTRRMLASIADVAPRAKILVTGCLAQQDPDRLKTMKNVAWVVGNRQKHEIPAILGAAEEGMFHSRFTSTDTCLQMPRRNIISPEKSSRTRFSVKIQEGCDFRCSYCIVPMLRGPSRSASREEILSLCSRAIDAGYKEIVLTGTHIGQYMNTTGTTFSDLVDSIVSLPGEFRVRLSSLDPRDCTSRILSRVGEGGKLCHHLHVSLQSGSASVLRLMGRPVDVALRVIAELQDFRRNFPTAGIGADIIVGFPGETEKDFLETCDVVQRIGLSYIHVFRYSRRPGTTAAGLPDQVSEKVKSDRSRYLRDIAAQTREKFIDTVSASSVPQRVIVESVTPVRGLTSNYLHAEVEKSNGSQNSWLDIYLNGERRGRYCLALPIQHKVA